MINRFGAVLTRAYLCIRFKSCGKGLRGCAGAHVKGFANIEIGDRFFAGPFMYMHTNSISDICIGDDVMFGPFVKVISGNHMMDFLGGSMSSAPSKTSGDDKGVMVGSDVWIGAGATILDGAIVSEGVVVAAGCVLAKYTPPYVIVGGVPGRVIKPRFSFRDLSLLLQNKESTLNANEIWAEYQSLGLV